MAVRNTTSINGTTSGTANTWTEVAAGQAGRQGVYIENPATNSAAIEFGFGAAASEAVITRLAPGEGVSYSGALCPQERLAIRSSGTSVPYTGAQW